MPLGDEGSLRKTVQTCCCPPSSDTCRKRVHVFCSLSAPHYSQAGNQIPRKPCQVGQHRDSILTPGFDRAQLQRAEEGRTDMAKRKRSTRSSSRSSKRSSSRSSTGRSFTGLFLAGAVIIGVGALTIWTAAHQKDPPRILSRIFERPATNDSRPTAAKPETEVKQAAKTKPRQNNRETTLAAPIPRPSVAVGPQPKNPDATKPVQQASLQPRQPVHRPDISVGAAGKVDIPLPRGVNMPNMAPSVVYARESLTLRRHAWDKSAPAGTVEKGREMRSYSKTGKWHRIAVPTTNMIGWVHEDMLIAGKSSMVTGAISGTPRSSQVQAVYPSRAIGAQ